ncbi:MAG TPA: TetR/AcrR family transcriptional regulator [Pseudonocardia sp.]|jgi:AcrR family transcriptional regulator|nr:TetR/AcrR family transcriptional regulator [Pseudonocardia sp.]
MTSPSEDRPALTKPRRTLRDQQREVTRQRLLEAGRDVFERDGYGQATVGDIANRAAVNRATFYLHFPSKAAIFEEILSEVTAEAAGYWRLLDTALTTGSRSAIRGWLASAFGWWDGNAAILAPWHEASASDPRIAAGWKGMFDQLARELEQYLGATAPPDRETARTRIQFLVVQLDQICFRWRVQRVFHTDGDQLLELLTDMWCSVLHITEP